MTCTAVAASRTQERKPAPDLALPDASGHIVHMTDFQGKVVLLDFWATWCGPCRTETPWLSELYNQYKSDGFTILGISMDDNWTPVKPFLARYNVPYPVVLGNDALTAGFGKLDALPVAYFVDRRGRVAATHVGAGSRKQFQQIIESLLNQ